MIWQQNYDSFNIVLSCLVMMGAGRDPQRLPMSLSVAVGGASAMLY